MSGGSGPNGWNKQSWIKDVLSKSGTDIVEVKEEKPKEIGTMVYYPSLPLIMKSETKKQQLLCSPLATTDPQTYQAAIALHRPRHQQQQQQPNQPQQLRQPISNNVMLTTNHSPSSSFNSTPTTSTSSTTATLLISQNQNFLQNIKIELPQQSFHLQQQHHAQQQLQPIDLQQTQNQQNGGSGGRMEAVSASQKVLYKCDQCMMNFGSKSAHTSHMKSHVKIENNYQSTATTESLGLSTGLGNGTVNPPSQNGTSATPNQGTSTGSDPYQCNVCKKTFAVPARLIRHYRTHTGERPFECEFCHKMFSVKENLQVHRRIHTKERPYKCDVCGRAFEHSGKLHRHMRIHTGERPHKCSVCSKTFIQSGQLVIHMRTHTGEKPYKCPVEGCGKGFTCSKQLKVHSRTHTGEKPYHCDICFRDFGYNHVLKLHRVQHYGSKCYKCTICDETFKSKKEMEAHIKRHANEMPDDDEEQQTKQQSGQLSPSISKQDAMSNSNANTSPAPQTQRRSPVRQKQQRQQQQRQQPRYTRRESLPDSERSHDSSTPSTNGSILIETPIDTGSEATSEGEEAGTNNSLYNNTNLYQRLGPSGLSYSLNSSRPTINPALLAAATIASRRVESESHNGRASPMETGLGMPSQILDEMDTSPSNEVLDFYHKPLDTVSIVNDMPGPVVPRGSQMPMPYEPLAVMKQNGYFAPAPVPEFRPSLRAANDIVRRVEAAIAGAEPLLTPPRLSSTESPERSSSPESDSLILADRDVMTLPLRKRKLYMSDNQAQDVSPVMRMSSVIQFAKAS